MAPRFDTFARILADDVTRRSALGRLGAGFSALLFSTSVAACDSGSNPVSTGAAAAPSPTAMPQGGNKPCNCRGQDQVCFQGDCTCPPGKQACGKKDDCVDYCGPAQVLDGNCSCVDFCAPGEAFCDGSCVSTACPPGRSFDADSCQCECSGGTTDCSGICVDTDTDDDNCGACGNACPSGEACVGGACEPDCGAGLTSCSGVCVDTATDANHCGACGAACAPYACSAGICLGTCSGHGDCSGPNYCDGLGSCVPKQGVGASCDGGVECLSNVCTGGVCVSP